MNLNKGINQIDLNGSSLLEDINTRSLQSISVGNAAGKLSTGSANVYIGYETAKNIVSSSSDCYIGYQAGISAESTSYMTVIGSLAGKTLAKSSETVFIGASSGSAAIESIQCVGVGAFTLSEFASGIGVVAIGYRSAERLLTGSFSVYIGSESGQNARYTSYNTVIGYRSGRSAFTSTYCTYVGAYAGYSNSVNNLNTSVGAYALYTNTGSSNTVVGCMAGAYATDANNATIIGTCAGIYSGGKDNTIVGTNAGAIIYGSGNTIIGSSTGKTLASGACNILVGIGAATYTNSVSYGISISSGDASTFHHSITVGETIECKRPNSTNIGYNLISDADNSVVIGNTISISSVTYLNDPLYGVFANTIAEDSITKFGISNINYTDTLVKPDGTSNIVAYSGVLTSNIVNSEINPTNNLISPNNYNLRTVLPNYDYLILRGLAIPVLDSLTSNVLATTIATANTVFNTYETNKPNGNSVTKPTLTNSSNIINTHTWYSSNLFYTSNVITNILAITSNVLDIKSFEMPVHFVKRGTIPVLSSTSSNVYYQQNSNLNLTNIYPIDISNKISLSIQGVSLSNVSLVSIARQISTPISTPTNLNEGSISYTNVSTINTDVTQLTNKYTYSPYIESSMNSNTSIYVTPVELVFDANSNIYGLPSSNVLHVSLNKTNSNVFVTDSIYFTDSNINNINNTQSHIFTTTDLFITPVSLNTPSQSIRFTSMDSNIVLTYGNKRYYSSNIATMVQEDIDNYNWIDSSFNSNIQSCIISASNLYIQTSNIFSDLSSNISVKQSLLVSSNANYLALTPIYNTSKTLYGTYWEPSNSFSNIWSIFSSNVVHWDITYNAFNYSMALSNVLTPFTNSVYYTSNVAYGASSSNLTDYIHGLNLQNYTTSSNIADTSACNLNIYLKTAQYLTIYHKYFEIPRLYLNYSDVRNNAIGFEYTSNVFGITTISPINFTFNNSNYSIPVRLPKYPSTNENYITSINVNTDILPGSIAIVNQSQSIAAISNNSNYTLIQANNPINGILWNNLTNSKSALTFPASNINQISYKITNPFNTANNYDTIRLVGVQSQQNLNPNNAHILQNFETNLIVNRIPSCNINTEAFDYRFQSYSNVVFDSNILTSIVKTQIPLTQTFIININNSNISSNTVLIDSDDPLNSKVFTSNILHTWNLDGLSAAIASVGYCNIYNVYSYSNINYHNLNITSFNELYTNSNTLYSSNITYSNITIESFKYNTINSYNIYETKTRKVYNTYLTQTTNEVIYYDTIGETAIPFESTSNLVTGRGYTYTSNFMTMSNVNIYEPVTRLTRLNTFVYNTVNYPLNQSVYSTHTSNIVSSWTNTDITNGYIWAASTFNYSNIYSNYTLPVNIYTSNIASNLDFTQYAALTLSVNSHRSSVLQIPEYSGQNVDINVISLDKGICVSNSFNNITGGEYIQTGSYSNDVIRYFVKNSTLNIPISPIIKRSITLTSDTPDTTPKQSFNFGIDTVINTKLKFFDTTGPFTAFNDRNVIVSPNSFTLDNMLANKVNLYITGSNITRSYSNLNVVMKNGANDTFLYPITAYNYNAFVQSNISQILQIEQIGYSNAKNTYIDNVNINPRFYSQGINDISSNIIVNIVTPPLYGTLVSVNANLIEPTQPTKTHFTLNDMNQSNIRYIPNTSMNLQNDVFLMRLVYGDIYSPTYSVIIKNYFSKFPGNAYTVDPTIANDVSRTVDLNSITLLSTGLIEDGYSWVTDDINLNSQYTIPSQKRIPLHDTVIPIKLMNSSNVLSYQSIRLPSLPYSVPNIITDSNLTISVDESDQCSLIGLNSLVTSNINTNDIIYNVIKQPYNGLIYNPNNGIPCVSFTSDDIIANRVVYQDIGGSNYVHSDSFNIMVSSTPYDLIDKVIAVNVNVRPMPFITKNVDAYVYYDSSNVATSTIIPFANSISFSNIHNVQPYLHIYSSNYVVANTINSNLVTDGFAIADSLFTIPNNGYLNTPMTMIIGLNSTAFDNNTVDSTHVNPLSRIPIYRNNYLIDWKGHLNNYISSNILDVHQPNSQQIISYTFDPTLSGYSNINDRKTAISFTLTPYQNLSIINNIYAGIQTVDFSVNIRNNTDGDIIKMHFYHDKTLVSINGTTNIYESDLIFNHSQIITLNNNDNNSGYSSLYVGTTDLFATGGGMVNAIDLTNIGVIEFVQNITNSRNFMAYSNFITPCVSLDANSTNLYNSYNLYNYQTAVLLDNFEISASTYKLDTIVSDHNTQNIVIGKDITVRGSKNLCIGTNFNTAGNNSIVIGNNIGNLISGQSNEIFESIVIGNSSFTDSIVKNVISIGNYHMNDLLLSSTFEVNEFLVKHPILIGNDITRDYIDYHINIGNTFLKTTVGGNQIYIGNTGENVCIGYTSNVQFNNINSIGGLYVNGSLQCDSVSTNLVTTNVLNTPLINNSIPIGETSSGVSGISMFDGMVVSINPDGSFKLSNSDEDPAYYGIYKNNAIQTFGITNVLVDYSYSNLTNTIGELLTTTTKAGFAGKQPSGIAGVHGLTMVNNYTIGKTISNNLVNNGIGFTIRCKLY